MIYELAADFAEALAVMPPLHTKRRNLALLQKAIRRDIHCVARHPSTLFQCMWNSCWWYDCPEAAGQYEVEGTGAPWEKPGDKLYEWMNSWWKWKKANEPGFYWLRSLRPPATSLGAGLLAVLRGHESSVTSVAFSPDGQRIVSGSTDTTVRVWDAGTGRELLPPLRGHESSVSSVAFSPDGQRIVSGSTDTTVRVWDAGTGRELLPPLRGHESSVSSVAFSPDGQRIVLGSTDTTVRVWDAGTGRELLPPLRGHESSVSSVAFSPDGQRIVSGSEYDQTLRIWDAGTGKCLEVHGSASDVCPWVHDLVAYEFVLNMDKTEMRVESIRDGQMVAWLGAGDSIQFVQGGPDGRTWAGEFPDYMCILRLEGGMANP